MSVAFSASTMSTGRCPLVYHLPVNRWRQERMRWGLPFQNWQAHVLSVWILRAQVLPVWICVFLFGTVRVMPSVAFCASAISTVPFPLMYHVPLHCWRPGMRWGPPSQNWWTHVLPVWIWKWRVLPASSSASTAVWYCIWETRVLEMSLFRSMTEDQGWGTWCFSCLHCFYTAKTPVLN